ncbi:DUF4232 domain-containing protein [Phytohabitans sp. ZYX-F-186]|uniref:DUF4232 domain-containing protein n=1 Tax=Phytohabitans maris TaxID=3071409 RepID=A0ABU0ZQZ5_9ACTN|nr:DUF4232 domain-containing protein [Phytohabitans sp. ZYX-F-186]MDQ7908347.1 DUF4232 domain-containing protein [Phytohabitans sp. ZYX-F-186]
MERAPRPWTWPLVRLAVGVALAAPIAVLAVDRLADADRRGGTPSGAAPVEALPGVTTTPPPPPSPSPAACPESGLSARPGAEDAAMGLRVLRIVVTNCGARTQTLRGHPPVRVLDEDRQPLDVTAGAGSAGVASVPSFDVAPATVTLRPGERAVAAVLWRNLVTDPSVRATEGHYLEVVVGSSAQVIAAEQVIDLGNTGKLGVAPWTAYPVTPSGDAVRGG